jgi:hypothetical protein
MARPVSEPEEGTERDRLARSLRETRLQLAMTQARLGALEQSATMELGRTLVRAARRPWPRGVQLPLELIRLWRERGAGPGAATLALASAQLGDLAGGGDRLLSALTAPGGASLVITGVLTARSCATLAPDAAVHPLLPHDAEVMLEGTGADLVLIEAAAMLAGSAWAYAGDPAAADRGRRLGRLIAAARALGKPVIFVRNIPAQLAPGLDWVAASCDAVTDDGFGVQLARFNPIGLDDARPRDPVYAGLRDPREPPAVRVMLDAFPLAGRVPWREEPALYRAHAVFVTASEAQARELLACGARVIMAGGEPAAGTITPEGRPLTLAEILPVLRDIFTTDATPVRLTALAALAGLPGGLVAGRQIAVLAGADDAAAAAALGASLTRQQLAPAELVVSVEGEVRKVTAALGDLRGTVIRVVTGGLSRAANAARSPWVAPWPADPDGSYLLDLACARECSQADAVGHAGIAYAYTSPLKPALARREFFTAAGDGHLFFSAS